MCLEIYGSEMSTLFCRINSTKTLAEVNKSLIVYRLFAFVYDQQRFVTLWFCVVDIFIIAFPTSSLFTSYSGNRVDEFLIRKTNTFPR